METVTVRPASRLWLHLLLFALTVVTTYFSAMGQLSAGEGDLGWWSSGSLAFSLALMAILGSHEMGHYVLARIHKVDTSLPYFIPMPIVGAGTLGAVIRIRGRIPHRNALVDIGAAGPLAGLAVALPLLFWGLCHSQVVDTPSVVGSSFPGEGSLWVLFQKLFAWAMEALTHAAPAAEQEPARQQMHIIFGDNLLMQGLTYLAVGPLPEGKDVLVHPVVIAGWFGLLVTLLNLMPIGQLDGGHLTFALFGPRAQWVGKAFALLLLFVVVFVSAFWAVWLLVASKVVGFGHPEVIEPAVPLSRGRKWICALCFVALICCAMPIPLRQVFS
jgi:membrane-associated protease RseP (regulator of RpoE activity)